MHVLFLTDNFPPEVNAPASRTFEHCRNWIKSDHKVTVLTCVPNFPKGQVYEGYANKLWQKEVMDGINVIRVKTYISANEGFLKRTLDYLSFMISSFLAALFVKKVDVVVGTSPQFFTVCSACMVGFLKGIPWVFELRDIWPESIKAVGAIRSSFVLKILERLELFLYGQAHAIVSVTNAFKENLVLRGVDAAKIHVVTNGVDVGFFKYSPKDEGLVKKYGLQKKFVAGYIGTHGMAHSLDILLDAAKILQDSRHSDRYRIVLIGDGSNKNQLRQRVAREALENVIFIDTVPKKEVVGHWSILDASIIHLKKAELFKTVIPSKLFESMGMGIPILHGVEGESAQIVEKEKVGVLFEPEDANGLIFGLQSLADDKRRYEGLRRNCSKAAISYDRDKLAGEMLKVLQRSASFG
mgnify:CR=1 FL=1